LEGDIFEFGVYKGGGTIAMALQLKILGSSKKIYAFDSFSGFPAYHSNDEYQAFETRPDLFEPELREQARLCKEIAEWRLGVPASAANISTSGDFSDISREWLENRLNAFGLDNVEIIEGNFKDTIPKFMKTFRGNVFSANIDCDLYDGYLHSLRAIYPIAVKGAMIYLDEYYSLKFPGARIAVNEFINSVEDSVTLLGHEKNDFQRWAIYKGH
tara:strand:- start:98 stop:739 length:642 start_codon:yes stop_codon:yes gene_type:complete